MSSSVTSGSGSLGAEIRGAAEFRRTLKKAGEDLEDMAEANKKVAGVVEEATLGLIPVDTGFLASTVRSSGTKTGATVRVGSAAVPYAGPIHWGWPARNIKANPFAADAAKESENIWGDIYRDAVEQALDRIKGA